MSLSELVKWKLVRRVPGHAVMTEEGKNDKKSKRKRNDEVTTAAGLPVHREAHTLHKRWAVAPDKGDLGSTPRVSHSHNCACCRNCVIEQIVMEPSSRIASTLGHI
jgi:hypothetical protein